LAKEKFMNQEVYKSKVNELQAVLKNRISDIVINADFFDINADNILVISMFWNRLSRINYENSHSIHYEEVPSLEKLESDILGYFNNF